MGKTMILDKSKIKLLKNPFVIIPAILVFLGLILLLSFFALNVYLKHPVGTQTSKAGITIKKGDGLRVISKELEDNKLLEHRYIFMAYLKIRGLSGDIMAGEYEIPRNSSPLEIIDILTKGKVASRTITIPEGWNDSQIADYLQEKGIVTKEQFFAATKKHYDYDFLKDLPEGESLEGFLFPDTYQISREATADEIVSKMLNNFDKKLTPELRTQITASNYNVYQTITLASIVEREASKPEDRKVVAGIFLSRLAEGMPLQSDVTLQYFLGQDKKKFSNAETQIPSPYNTYLHNGLPVGPICNPGLESINAVLHPQITQFRYFLASEDGTVYYSKTLEEHETLKAKYLE